MNQEFLDQVWRQMQQLVQKPGPVTWSSICEVMSLILQARIIALTNMIFQANGPLVQTGPFAGMVYMPQIVGSVPLPKLLGCYEAELHPVLTRVMQSRYPAIINIGAGEGYYAVGLARMLPGTTVFAFESDSGLRDLCRQMAAANGVASQVEVHEECNLENLRQLVRPGMLVFCDCEGGERTLMDPGTVPGLAFCDLIIEVHDFLETNLSQIIQERFKATHEATLFVHAGRNPNAYPAVRGWQEFDRYLAVCEGRPGPTPWLYLISRTMPIAQ